MVERTPENLAPELQIAIAHTPVPLRDALRIFLELDARLARIVAATNEPILGQMRLTWWREMLEKPVEERPKGDTVLDGIGQHWLGYEPALIFLVDGWEHMLADTFGEDDADAFGNGRAAPFQALLRMDENGAGTGKAGGLSIGKIAARRWALVDAALHLEPGIERDMLTRMAREVGAAENLPKALRGLAILDALARRSLNAGLRPLMVGRVAPIVATRAAIFGR